MIASFEPGRYPNIDFQIQAAFKLNEIIEVLNEHTKNHLPNTVLKHAHVLKGPDS